MHFVMLLPFYFSTRSAYATVRLAVLIPRRGNQQRLLEVLTDDVRTGVLRE